MPYLMGAPFIGFLDPAGTLADLMWLLPYLGPYPGAPANPAVAACPTTASQSTTMGGPPGTLYDVTFEFRGKIELYTYTGGTSTGGLWYIGGSPQSPNVAGWNVYRLDISDPAQHFFLNAGGPSGLTVFTPYQKTVTIRAGATVTLSADAVDLGLGGGEVSDGNFAVGSISVPGVTNPAQPYAGQFIRMDVISITPQ